MSNGRKITNTSQRHAENPMLTLAEAALFGGSQSIERSEAIGQQQLVESTDLPADGSGDPAWAVFGVTFGPPHADDPIFRPSTLPEGWKKVGTDHAMWSKLVDQDGNERAGIFYKAAFYDRKAHMRPTRRFSIRENYELNDNAAPGADRKTQHSVTDKDVVVFSTAIVSAPDTSREWLKTSEARKSQQKECAAWLVEHGYPDWDNAASYWT